LLIRRASARWRDGNCNKGRWDSFFGKKRIPQLSHSHATMISWCSDDLHNFKQSGAGPLHN
jgi:hypothetical protein